MQGKKRPGISNDYVVYSLEHECDMSDDKDLVSFKQAMECNNSEKRINAMKKELKSMDENKVCVMPQFPGVPLTTHQPVEFLS